MIAEHQKLVRVSRDQPERTCIVCPIGCRLSISLAEDRTLVVSGNRCKRGVAYAEEEFRDPRRVVTATIAVRGGRYPRLPVRSSARVPVDLIAAFLNEIYSLEVGAPLPRGRVVARDVAGTGIDLLTTATAEATEEA